MSAPDPQYRQDNKNAAIKVTLIGALLDLVLGLLKIAVGSISGSLALVSDGIHSLSDLVTDAFVLFITRFSHEEPDAEHPYGHGRFETIGTIIIGIGLFIIAGVILYDSARRIGDAGSLIINSWPALLVALFSILGKEWIYHYTKKVADRIGSSMLLANAWHSRTDAFSSIVVLLGLVGVMLGYPWMDLVAAMLVALLIAKIAWNLVWASLRELVDTALPKSRVREIREHILAMNGVKGVHSLRTRQLAGQTFLDIHVQVDSKISVSEGHYLGDCINGSLKTRFGDIVDVTIHIDPELDTDDSDLSLPLRNSVLETLLQCWQGEVSEADISKMTLHYLDQKIQVELILNIKLNTEIEDKLNNLVKEIEWLHSISYYGTV